MSRPKIVVSDSSVVTDLAKVKLIEPVVRLPFEFVIPDVILAQDLLDLGPYSAAELVRLGFVEGALDGVETRCARDYFLQHRRNDVSPVSDSSAIAPPRTTVGSARLNQGEHQPICVDVFDQGTLKERDVNYRSCT